MSGQIQHGGFSLIDIWELCTAYYMPRNKLRKQELLALLDSYGFQCGLLTDKPRPEYSARYREAYEAGKGALKTKPAIETEFDHATKKKTGIIIAGSAGQKIKSAATLFAEAAIGAGLNATQKDDYPITVQTGHSVAEIIVSPQRIDYTGIDAPDYCIVISADGLKRVRAKIEKLPATCKLFADDSLELPETKAQIHRLPLQQIAKDVGKLSVVTGAVAAMLQDSGLFPMEAFVKTISTFQSPKIAEINLKAVTAGAEMMSPA